MVEQIIIWLKSIELNYLSTNETIVECLNVNAGGTTIEWNFAGDRIYVSLRSQSRSINAAQIIIFNTEKLLLFIIFMGPPIRSKDLGVPKTMLTDFLKQMFVSAIASVSSLLLVNLT